MTDDQLVVLDQDRGGFAGVTEGFGPQQNGRHAQVGFDDFGKGERAIDRDAGTHGQIAITQALQTRR
ncbi:hypothetical protein D3C76_1261930 [compost metagenome]